MEPGIPGIHSGRISRGCRCFHFAHGKLNYRPHTECGKVMFFTLCVCPQGGGGSPVWGVPEVDTRCQVQWGGGPLSGKFQKLTPDVRSGGGVPNRRWGAGGIPLHRGSPPTLKKFFFSFSNKKFGSIFWDKGLGWIWDLWPPSPHPPHGTGSEHRSKPRGEPRGGGHGRHASLYGHTGGPSSYHLPYRVWRKLCFQFGWGGER